MKSKKFLIFLIIAAIVLSILSGCGKDDAGQQNLTPQTAPAEIAGSAATESKAQTETAGLYPCLVEGTVSVQESTGIPTNTRHKYNVGNCTKLEGSPFVLAIFLDDDVSSWTEEGVYTYWSSLIAPALAYLEENAALWDVELEFQSGYYATYGHPDRPVKYDGVVETYNDGNYSKDILDQAAISLGFETKEHMHEQLQEFSGQEQIAYVIMLNKGGRSYSISYGTRHTEEDADYKMEYSVIYTGFTDTSGDSASDTVAHEMLHLFGAEDYYYPDNRKQLASEVYPTDLMLCAMPDLEYFELGDFTAYTVGWTDEVPDVCSNPDWWS